MIKGHPIIVLTIFLVLIFSTVSLADTFPVEAINTAENFAKTLDYDNYDDAYDNAAPLLRALNSKEDWIKSIVV